MSYATTVKEVPNAFNLDPLKGDELKRFYVETMLARTGNENDSPILDIIDDCKTPRERNSFLLLGHRGCGKSTELNKMAVELEREGYPVHIIACDRELDFINITHSDLLILMGDALLEIAADRNISLAPKLEEKIRQYWRGTITKEEADDSIFGAELMAKLNASAGIRGILSFLLDVKNDIRFSETKRKTYRETVEKRPSEWIRMLCEVIDAITVSSGQKQPILIFDELEKLESAAAWRVFNSYSNTLSCLPSPTIYTFPIFLSYAPQFNALSSFFKIDTMPMIKIMNLNESPNKAGRSMIEKIVEKRMDTSLFQEGTLQYLIKMTGGHLRDLFSAIVKASRPAARRGSPIIEFTDAQSELSAIKSNLTKRIDAKFYPFLVDICKGNRQQIPDKEMLCEALRAGVVLEYSGTRDNDRSNWYDVHPLVKEFLAEQKLLEKNQGLTKDE